MKDTQRSPSPEARSHHDSSCQLGNDKVSMAAKQIEKKTKNILNVPAKKTGVTLRDE